MALSPLATRCVATAGLVHAVTRVGRILLRQRGVGQPHGIDSLSGPGSLIARRAGMALRGPGGSSRASTHRGFEFTASGALKQLDREPKDRECVVVARNSGRHSCKPGQRLAVCAVDDGDSTLRGFPSDSAEASDWVPWGDVEPVRFGWNYVQKHVPPDVAAVLSGCEGSATLALNRQVKLAILATLPDLRGRIMEAVSVLDAADDSDD